MLKSCWPVVYSACYSLGSLTSIVESFNIDNKACRPQPLQQSHLANDQLIRESSEPGGPPVRPTCSDYGNVCSVVATQNRRATISILSALTAVFPFSRPCLSFEGGIGGLGKTKPQTGAILWDPESTPVQSDRGAVSAELDVANRAVLIFFQSPWPLTGTVETRNIVSGESAFVQVVDVAGKTALNNPQNGKEAMKQLLLGSVLAQQGKFGAYGSPFDVKIAGYEVYRENGKQLVKCTVSFKTLTLGTARK